jgi:hypothetical protein
MKPICPSQPAMAWELRSGFGLNELLGDTAAAATSHVALDGRTGDAAVRAEHATVSRLWCKDLTAGGTVMEECTSIG